MKQGIHDKDNPLLSPGSNGSSANNNNAGSPSPITSPIMGPIPPNSSTSSDLETQGSINGDQIMGGGPISGSVMGAQTAWTPPSVDEEDSPSPSSGLSPNQGITSPGNSSAINSTSMYSMMPNHQNIALKSELSSPGENSPSMLPSYPLNNGVVMSSMGVGDSNPQMATYLSESSMPQQPLPTSSMMTASLWYSGSESTSSMHPMSHLNHRGMNEASYMK